MQKETLDRYVATLKEEQALMFEHSDSVFKINWSELNNGWNITGYSEVDDEGTGDSNLIVDEDLCALCTGSEQDAILFFITGANVEEQRKLFFKLVESSDINIVTCGDCGLVVFHERTSKDDIHCPHCLFTGEPGDFPDFYY